MRKVCVITGSRAEYGLLSRLMKLIKEDSDLILQIIVTNMHLSPEFGNTYQDIEKDGFHIDKKVHMLLSSDTANATAKSIGVAVIGFADAYEDLSPDLILVLGDRYEMLAAVSAALVYKIPVAHIHGGEITEGAFDDSIRHSISKMSHLHFTSTDEYRNRVIQLGEDPAFVFNVGAIGIDNLKHLNLLTKESLEEDLNFKLSGECILVTYHTVTLEDNTAQEQIENLLEVLKEIKNLQILFTLPNSDPNGHIIKELITKFVEENKDRSAVFAALGQIRYLSVLKYINAVVGNSSSGLIEVPSMGIPTLNIGSRQQGRLKPKTVVDCETSVKEIRKNLLYILSSQFKNSCKNAPNPYEKKNTASEILSVIKKYDLQKLVKKRFHNL